MSESLTSSVAPRGTRQSHDEIPLRRIQDGQEARIGDESQEAQSSSAVDTLPLPGWEAWTVVAASTLFFFVTLGLVYSFGVTQRVLIERNFSSASTLGWVSSLTIVYAPLLALPIQMLVLRRGNRFVGLLGALCVGTGYILTSFCVGSENSAPSSSAKRVAPLMLSQSLFGIGYALVFWSCNSLVTQWFPPRRIGLAVGIVYAGSGVGGAVFSIGLSSLIKRIGLENSLRVYGAIALALLVPASWWLKRAGQTRPRNIRWAVARDRRFVFLLIATSLITFSLFVPPFFLPTYAASAGFSNTTGAWLVAGYNLSSAVGRVFFGVVADGRLGPVTTLWLCFVLFGTTILSIWVAAAGRLAPLIIFMLLNGAAGGALLSLQPTVSASVWKGNSQEARRGGEVESVLAMSTMGRVFGSLLGSPSAGYLLDAFGGPGFGTGAYRPALLVIGCVSMLASFSLLGLRWSVVGWSLAKRV